MYRDGVQRFSGIGVLQKGKNVTHEYYVAYQNISCKRAVYVDGAIGSGFSFDYGQYCGGFGRYTYNDTKNFFIIARGSTTEVLEHCQTAFDEGYINEEVFRNCEQLCEEIYRLLNGCIAYLNKQQQGKTK